MGLGSVRETEDRERRGAEHHHTVGYILSTLTGTHTVRNTGRKEEERERGIRGRSDQIKGRRKAETMQILRAKTGRESERGMEE